MVAERATGVVVVGLLFEAFELVPEIVLIVRRKWSERRLGIKLLKADIPEWLKIVAFVGWFLIVAGVAGEYVADSFVSKADGFVQKFDEILLTDAQYQAELAKERAGGAYERAATAEKEVAQLRKDAEGLKSENLRLEAIIAPRSLSLDQQRRIADACNIFKGHNALVESYGLDAEAFAIGEQLITTLRAMRVTVADARASAVVTGQMESGLHVRTVFIQEFPFASCIAHALSDVGHLETALNDSPPPSKGMTMGGGGQSFKPNIPFVTIFIGTKPLPLLTDRHNKNITK